MKKQMSGILGLALVMAIGFATIVRAEDDYKKFGVRVRAIYVTPAESVDSRVDAVFGKRTTVSDSIIPELDLEYFFFKNVSLETFI